MSKEQPEVIFEIIAFIYILLGEEFECFRGKGNAIIENLFDVIYPKYSVDSLKQLFNGYIQENFCCSRKKIELLLTLFEREPKVFSTPELIKINRTISYMSFILKDVKEYIIQKHPDGVFFEEIRFARQRIAFLKQKI